MIFFAEKDGAEGRAVKFGGGNAGGKGAALDEEGDKVGRAERGGADVDFKGGHFGQDLQDGGR